MLELLTNAQVFAPAPLGVRHLLIAGGRDAKIAVIPTASRLEETGERYERLFRGIGAGEVLVLDFDQRNRLGRLITALAFNPFLIGLGLDEDTAAFIGPDQSVEVEGSGTLTVVDADHLKFSSMAQAGPHDPVSVLGLTMHVLIRGATFNLHTRHASAGTLAAIRSRDAV